MKTQDMPRRARNFSPVDLGFFEIKMKQPIAPQVYAQLRSKILCMEILPDQEISEAHVAECTGVSRTPVRQVVKQLVDEGLLISYPSRGTLVSRIDAARVRDALFVRAQLEPCLAAHRAASADVDETVHLLQEILDRHASALRANRLGLAYECDYQFHERICSSRPGSFVWQILHKARTEADRLHALGKHRGRSLENALTQHITIMEALRDRNPDAAREAMRIHMQHNETLLETVQADNPDMFS